MEPNTTDKTIWIEGRPVFPERRASENPIDYYERTGCCPDNLAFEGKYYCNPAHCRAVFDNVEERDEHLKRAYAILG